jgi:hypothetical protein
MHLGAAVRQLLTDACDADLRHAKAHTIVEALESPSTRRRLGADIETTFGVRVSESDLARLSTVRDVLQCVRLYRWAKRVETDRGEAGAAESAAVAGADTPATIAARALDPRQQTFRITRRPTVEPPAAPVGEPRGPKRL